MAIGRSKQRTAHQHGTDTSERHDDSCSGLVAFHSRSSWSIFVGTAGTGPGRDDERSPDLCSVDRSIGTCRVGSCSDRGCWCRGSELGRVRKIRSCGRQQALAYLREPRTRLRSTGSQIRVPTGSVLGNVECCSSPDHSYRNFVRVAIQVGGMNIEVNGTVIAGLVRISTAFVPK